MNERIRKLAIKADELGENVSFEFCEKFAELIVQECVAQAEREWIRNGPDTEHNRAVSQVTNAIKKHFGIK